MSATRGFAGALVTFVVAAALLGGAVELQAIREQRFPASEVEDDTLYISSPAAIQRLSGPYAALAADVYWIRTIQYYGGAKQSLAARAFTPDPPRLLAAADQPEYRRLFPLLDITTTLDPHFDIAYRFGAVFLAEAFPGGAGRPDLAVTLLEKGLRAQPDKWQYMEDIGFVHYWYGHDYRQAAGWFAKAGELPGAPNWLKPLAATTLAQGGDRRSSRTMWQAILRSSEVDWLRAQAERRLLQLNALDEIDQLQLRVDAYSRQTGRPVTDWLTMMRARIFPGVPVDPGGTRYELTPEGRVQLSQSSTLFPLPSEPERLGPS